MGVSWMHRIAWILGAFTLVILGAMVGQMTWDHATAEPTPAMSTAVASDPDPGLETLLREREQAYRRMIAEANAQLEQAYRQIQELSAQLSDQRPADPSPAPSASGVSAEPEVSISPARAIWIAMNAAPGSALMKEPELVLFEGTLAYEVTLDQGLLYIDANTGRILYNGIPPVIQIVEPGPSQPVVQTGPSADGGRKEEERKVKKEEHREDKEKEEHGDDD